MFIDIKGNQIKTNQFKSIKNNFLLNSINSKIKLIDLFISKLEK